MRKTISLTFVLICLLQLTHAQTPVNMSVQPGFTYTENFADINNWTFSTTPANGTFTAGIGAAAWRGNDINTTGTVPAATRITVNSTFFQTPPSQGGASSGFYKGTGNIAFLATGTTDNTTSVTVDFFMNFTGVNAGTLSFDWASINNSTGNRNGSLKVYASIDGNNWTEITTAQVNNVTNNSPTSGSVTNAIMPAIFNNSATARLRFYYFNGVGGTTGSRPRLSIDNVKVTALPTNTCTTPAAQPTGFNTTSVIFNTIQASFTAATPAPQNYLVVMSLNNALSSGPINGTNYAVGDNLGDGNVIAITSGTTFSVTNLNPSTTYYFFIFSVNNVCTGGPLYLTLNPLTGNATTLAGALPCVAPLSQPTGLSFSNITINSLSGSFTAANNTNEYLVVRTTSPTLTGTPNNGTVYNPGNFLGNGTVISRSALTTFNATSLSSSTTYYFFVFGLNNQNCNNGPSYNTSTPLTASATTATIPACTTPTAQPNTLVLTPSNTFINGSFNGTGIADGFLIVRTTTSTLSATPVDGTNYTTGASLGNGTVISNNSNTSFFNTGLTPATTYYYFVFARNNDCIGGPKYIITNPLTGNTTTTLTSSTNFYFGNLHAHSRYSDGNVDNPTFTPADNYTYAKSSLCMDFLGISEHNHAEAGMSLSNWNPGLTQAAAATTANFVALYGMEYGVISNGGHVLIYGTNQLIGWEAGNYNVFVPKSDYLGTPETTGITGLFRTVNNLGGNTFATFAHPSFSDYNNLSNINFNATADSAVVGSALASGVAFSTNTTYSDPPSSFAYIDYFMKMLAKGYHLGPLMDHDTHNTNFGRSSNNRLAIVAPTLTQNSILTAMKSRSFYASEDCDTRVIFTLNNQPMGSIFTGASAPAITVYAIDPTNAATPTIRLFSGVPGSNILPVQISSSTGNTLILTDNLMPNNSTAYYYAEITIAGNKTLTAPIWYTRNTPVFPVSLFSFSASLNNNKTVSLNWITSREINSKLFVIEKSANGTVFSAMDSVNAQRNSNTPSRYAAVDFFPADGMNYYRLKMIDTDGKFSYSNIVAVNLKNSKNNNFTISPNPVQDVLMLNIQAQNSGKGTLIIHDVFGRTVSSVKMDIVSGTQVIAYQTAALSKGNYFVTLSWANEKITHKLIKN